MRHPRSSSGIGSDQAHHRRLTRVRIGPSCIQGLGLFAVTPIKNGTRILPYHGAKIPPDEGARRAAQGNAYIFAFNDRYDIDGQSLTNTARFINHSCAPNCATLFTRRTIWVVAARAIAPGEELTYNYGYDMEDYAQHPCHCGAAQCCGYMLDRKYWSVIERNEG